MSLAKELRVVCEGEVSDDAATLARASSDASLFVVRPQVVVFPKHVDDIKRIVGWTSEQRKKGRDVSLTVRSGGTDMSGGPLSESIVLDVNRNLNRIKEVGDRYAVTEPGVWYRDFEKATLAKGYLLPSYPASREICTVGGMAANNAGGEKSLRYGKTDQYVAKLKVVLADGNEYSLEKLSRSEIEQKIAPGGFEGELYQELFELFQKNTQLIASRRPRVSKNSSGYNVWEVWAAPQGGRASPNDIGRDRESFDLAKLFCGSQGTLGIITEITFRLIKPKPERGLLIIFLKDLSLLAEVTDAVLRFKPMSFELFDDHTFRLALKFFPSFLKLLGVRNLFSLAFAFLPEFLMLVRRGLPKLVFLAEFEGEKEKEIGERIAELNAALKKYPVSVHEARSELEMRKYFAIRRESFNLLRQRIKGLKTAPFIDDIIVVPERLEEFIPRLNVILERYPSLIYTIAGHAGDGNLHIIPLMNLHDESQRALIPKLTEEVYELVFSFGGSMSGEHNDGLIRTPYLEKMYGPEMTQLFQEIKRIFDPQNIFNPGKKVGGDLNYALAHIRRD